MAQSKKRTRSTSRLLALEPRLLFDGAAMVAAQDVAYQNDAHTQDGDKQGHASDPKVNAASMRRSRSTSMAALPASTPSTSSSSTAVFQIWIPWLQTLKLVVHKSMSFKPTNLA